MKKTFSIIATTLILVIGIAAVVIYVYRDKLLSTFLTSSTIKSFHGYTISIPNSHQTSTNALQSNADLATTDQLTLIDKSFLKNQDTFIPYLRVEYYNVTPSTKSDLKAWVTSTFLAAWDERPITTTPTDELGYRFEDTTTVGNSNVLAVTIQAQSNTDLIKAFLDPKDRNGVIVVHQLSTGQSTVETQELASEVQDQVIKNIIHY